MAPPALYLTIVAKIVLPMSKRALLTWHRRLGLCCALFLAIQGVSGAALALRQPLEWLIAPELRLRPEQRPILSIGRQIAAARAAVPGGTLRRATYDDDVDAAPRFLFTQGESGAVFIVAIDPGSGTVLREGGVAHWPVEWLLRLHANLMGGRLGQLLVGLDGAALTMLIVFGLRLWWPGWKRLRKSFALTHSAGAERLMRSLHRSMGAVGALLLLCTALTGTVLCWLPYEQAGLGAGAIGLRAPSIDAALAGWMARSPDLRISRIDFLTADGASIRVNWISSRAGGASTLLTSKETGVSLMPLTSTTLFSRVFNGALTVHSGRILGPVGTLAVSLSAALLILMCTTGVYIWYRAKLQKNLRKTAK